MDFHHLLSSEPNIYSLVVHDDAIDFLFIQKSGKGLQKKILDKIILPAGFIEKGVLKQPEKFIKVVKACFEDFSKQSLKKQKYVMLSIPDDQVFVKRYEFSNKLEKSEVNDSIKLNENIQLPFSLLDSYYDMETRTAQKNDWQEIFFVQIKKTVIDSYISALKSINVDVIIVECETLSMIRTFNFELSDPYLIIRENIDGFNVSFVLEKELKFFSYHKFLNGKTKDKKIEQLKKLTKYFLNYLEVEFGKNIKNIVFISGNDLSYKKSFLGIMEDLKKRDPEIQQIPFEDFIRADVKSLFKKTYDAKILPIFGLGLRTLISREDDKLISLLPIGTEESYLIKRSISYTKMVFDMIVFSCLLLVILFGGTFAFIKFFIGADMHKSFQLSSAMVQESSFVELEIKAKEFNQFMYNVEQANNFKNKISEPLEDFQKIITPGITITGIKGGEQNSIITVSGISLTREQVIAFQNNLIDSEKFYDVELPLSLLASEKNVVFQINMKWK